MRTKRREELRDFYLTCFTPHLSEDSVSKVDFPAKGESINARIGCRLSINDVRLDLFSSCIREVLNV